MNYYLPKFKHLFIVKKYISYVAQFLILLFYLLSESILNIRIRKVFFHT